MSMGFDNGLARLLSAVVETPQIGENDGWVQDASGSAWFLNNHSRNISHLKRLMEVPSPIGTYCISTAISALSFTLYLVEFVPLATPLVACNDVVGLCSF